jgi:NAD-dependent dihydropyrimidine dehydrogenase PreA subunit
MENEQVVVKDASKCIVCRACEVQCPHKAIEVHEPKHEHKVEEQKPAEHKTAEPKT